LNVRYTSSNYSCIFYFNNGTLDFNGQYARLDAFSGNATGARSLDIRNATIRLQNNYSYWNYTGNLSAEGSTIYLSNSTTTLSSSYSFTAAGAHQYHDVCMERGYSITNGRYNKLVLTEVAGVVNNIVADTLQLDNSTTRIYNFTAGATTTVNKAFYGSGTNCTPITLQSTVNGSPANLSIAKAAATIAINPLDADTLYLDFIKVNSIHAVTGTDRALLQKGLRSPDENQSGSVRGFGSGTGNNNTGNWIMEPFDNTGTFKPLGGDVTLPCTAYPYTIRSTYFLPTPSSIFEWKKGGAGGTTVGRGPDYIVANMEDAGIYYLSVTTSGCALSDTKQLLTNSNDSLIWTGVVDADWNNAANWKNSVNVSDATTIPDACTSVLIPAGLATYPNLALGSTTYVPVDRPAADCRLIYFEHGAEVVRTDSLHYRYASVNLTINGNQWYLFSAPLKNLYTGDIYVNDPNPFIDGYSVEPMLLNVVNPETGLANTTTTGYKWTGSFNTPDYEMKAGQGFALWIDETGTDYDENNATLFRFPKNDLKYYYYNEGTGRLVDSTAVLNRTYSQRFIYENDPLTDPSRFDPVTGNVNLETGAQSIEDGKPLLTGNPFMAHLNFQKFLDSNPNLYDEYKLAYGLSTANGMVNSFSTYKKSGGVWYTTDPADTEYDLTAAPLIAPMQAFVVIPKGSLSHPLRANIKDTESLPGNVLRSGNALSETSRLSILAVRGEEKSKALLLLAQNASIEYNPEEDSQQLFSESSLKPVLLYTRSKDGYALDVNAIGNQGENIPLCVRTSVNGEISFRFEGMETFGSQVQIYLLDTKTGESFNLSQRNSYSFVKDNDNMYLEDRFYLSFQMPTGLNAKETASISVTTLSAGGIHIISGDGSPLKNVRIFDMQGKCLLNEEHPSGFSYTYKTALPGMYIIQAANERSRERLKVIVRQ
jgi:hypothetical protein